MGGVLEEHVFRFLGFSWKMGDFDFGVIGMFFPLIRKSVRKITNYWKNIYQCGVLDEAFNQLQIMLSEFEVRIAVRSLY